MAVLDHAQTFEGKHITRYDEEDGNSKMATREEDAYEWQGCEIVFSLVAVGIFEDRVTTFPVSPELVMVQIDQECSEAS